MNIPFQVKVPVDLAVELRNRLREVEIAHDKVRERFAAKAKTSTNPDKTLAEQSGINEQGRRVTVQHLIRVFIQRGMAELAGASADKLLTLMSNDTIVIGRPGAKRGTHAA